MVRGARFVAGRRGGGFVGLAIALPMAARPAVSAVPPGAVREFFESKVRPVLVERCGECHGATGKVKGGLRLLSREGVLKGGDGGPAAVAGKPEESALVHAV